MTTPAREAFQYAIREHLAPRLRTAGFQGSGRSYLRTRNETLNAISIRVGKYHDRFFVGLGLHFTFLPPNWAKSLRPGARWTEADCEFRWALTATPGLQGAWEYGGDRVAAEAQARSVVEAYFRYGEREFDRFATPESVARAVPLEALEEGLLTGLPWETTDVRLALALSRIHRHLGDLALSARFAEVGLGRVGQATALRFELEALARQA